MSGLEQSGILPKVSLKYYKSDIKRLNKAVWDNPANVLENLYLSSIEPAENTKLLKELGIKLIVDLSGCAEHSDGFTVIKLRVSDDSEEDIKVHFDRVNKAIDEYISKGDAVLVHCLVGCSRSATIVLAYLIYKGASLYDSYEYLLKYRPAANPNPGFMAQLSEYEVEMHHLEKTTFTSQDYTILKLSRGVGAGIDKKVLFDILESCSWNSYEAVYEVFKWKKNHGKKPSE